MDTKNEIIKILQKISGRYSPLIVFGDWVELMALSIQNGCMPKNNLWDEREKRYLQIMGKYTKSEQKLLVEMFSCLQEALEENIEDVLGYVYMNGGCYNNQLGQFFTPFHLSKLNASIMAKSVEPGEIISINEPSTGAGGMIIGYAAALKEKGIDYQNCMDVVAQDIDWLGVYMSYVQFSLLGIRAKVIQGNSLDDKTGNNLYSSNVLMTPRKMGVY